MRLPPVNSHAKPANCDRKPLDRLGLSVGDPPLPLQRPPNEATPKIEAALDRLAAL